MKYLSILILLFISSICFADNVRYPFPQSYKLVNSRYGCCANYHYFGFDIVYLPCYNYHGCKATSERTDCEACKNRTCKTYCPPTCPKRKALAKWVEELNNITNNGENVKNIFTNKFYVNDLMQDKEIVKKQDEEKLNNSKPNNVELN